MRNWLVLTVVFWANALYAQTKDETCATIGVLAEAIMSIRQDGTPMSWAIENIIKKDNEPETKMVRELIVSAYEQPKYSTEEMKKSAMADFRNEAELACFKGMMMSE